jgi:hypothetical protein
VIYLESSGADLVGKELGVGMTTELNSNFGQNLNRFRIEVLKSLNDVVN